MTDQRAVRPMKIVLGGIPSADDIVGREAATAEVLAACEDHGHGALLTGDRRYGKTSLTRLVEVAAKRAGHRFIRVSAERQSFEDFVEALADALGEGGSALRREVERWRVSLTAGPVKAERTSAPAVRGLDKLVRAAVEAEPDALLILCIDEIPVLAKAMESQQAGGGSELLHLLRRLRQDNTGRLAMVLLGSIGFHHVTVDALGTTNDVQRLSVGALSDAEALYLARCLLAGEKVSTDDELALGQAIAAAAENVPYYIQHLVKSARDRSARGDTVTAESVPSIVEAALTDPDDPWDLRHYRDRIRGYYGPDLEELSYAILDIFSESQDSLSIDALERHLQSFDVEMRPRRSQLIPLVERLEADHYLAREGSGSRFASDLLRRAWISHRRR